MQNIPKQLSLCLFAFLLSHLSFAQQSEMFTPQWRPVYHFTPEKNWTNDPNGLIYVNGKYELYNQQNPYENKWGHMSWGHATSTDLLHWQHHPVAMLENINNGDTTWRFSGCVVRDKNNTSGFCKNGDCLVAIYTAHSPNRKNESQYIAYSNDGGITYTQYENNPVIDLGKQDFRDPNVQWYEPLKKWLMTVVLPAEHKAQFYESADLKKWNLLSEFDPQGYTGANWECPFLIQLPVDGGNAQKWVLAVSAAGGPKGVFEQYFVGDFDGKNFTNDNPADAILPLDNGNTFYAAIPWNEMPGNGKTYIGWMIPLQTQTAPWRGQMSIPRDLSLRTTSEGIRLFQTPSTVVTNSIYKLPAKQQMSKQNIKIDDKEIVLNTQPVFSNNAYWIEADFMPGTAKDVGFIIAKSSNTTGTIINYNVAANELTIKPEGADEVHSLKAAVQPVEGKIKLQILLDKSSLEVFANSGEKVITTYIFPQQNATQFAVFAKGGAAALNELKMYAVQ